MVEEKLLKNYTKLWHFFRGDWAILSLKEGGCIIFYYVEDIILIHFGGRYIPFPHDNMKTIMLSEWLTVSHYL